MLQVGPRRAGAKSRGGIATVMSLVLAHPDPAVRLEHAVTFGDVSKGGKVRLAVGGLAHVTAAVVTGRVDVVHAHMSFKGSVVRKALALRIAQVAGVPTVLHAHSHGFTRWYTGLPTYQQRAVRAALHADRWLVLGSAWAHEYAQHLGVDTRRITVLHNPTVVPQAHGTTWTWPDERAVAAIDDTRSSNTGAKGLSTDRSGTPTTGNDARSTPAGAEADRTDAAGRQQVRMVFLGRLGQRKGCFDLIRALARLDPAVRARLHLVMAGDGDLEGVRRAVGQAGLAQTVTLPGWIDEQTRAALLASADVLVLPSHQEGLPMAVLEGMAAGLAVLTTPVGGLPEVIDDDVNGLLVPPGDDARLASAIDRLVADAAMRRRLGDAARATSAAFDVERWYAQLTRIWREVVADRLGRSPLA